MAGRSRPRSTAPSTATSRGTREQSITAREALAASTDGWGTIAVGHPADLVLLSADPLDGDSDEAHASRLRSMAEHVRGTWVAGQQVHAPA